MSGGSLAQGHTKSVCGSVWQYDQHGQVLVAIWNRQPGVTPVAKFENRSAAVRGINLEAAQNFAGHCSNLSVVEKFSPVPNPALTRRVCTRGLDSGDDLRGPGVGSYGFLPGQLSSGYR